MQITTIPRNTCLPPLLIGFDTFILDGRRFMILFPDQRLIGYRPQVESSINTSDKFAMRGLELIRGLGIYFSRLFFVHVGSQIDHALVDHHLGPPPIHARVIRNANILGAKFRIDSMCTIIITIFVFFFQYWCLIRYLCQLLDNGVKLATSASVGMFR